MGYANLSQIGTGLRQRLFSRAFIIGSPTKPAERVVYLVLDTQSGDTAIRNGILEGVKALGGDYSMYTAANIAVTGTHSHSGPAAWLNYLLPQVTSLGFDKQSYNAIVTGAVLSIQRAHQALTPGSLSFGSTDLENANINRSPYAYLANPAEERAKYTADVDKTMTMLNFQRASDGKSMGVLTWFPVHGTSMLGNNTIVTGDNKGVAASLFEKSARGSADAVDGFVAGFSQANVGDTSPNINGAYCEDGSNQMCSFEQSLCGGKNEPCHGRGPFYGLNDGGTKSCYEIGRRQSVAAQSLFHSLQSGGTPINGDIRSFHTFRDFGYYQFQLANGTSVQTCPGALGYSFAAGTTDGPGAFDFKQNASGSGDASPVWAVARDLLHDPDQKQRDCQAPKPILLDAGETFLPYQWAPNITDLQLLRVGQLLVIVSPGEATTMSGRRWKAAIGSAAAKMDLVGPQNQEPIVVLGAPANSYTHYIATEEEYLVQRYEGASTLYGRHTLNAYINTTTDLLPYLASTLPSAPLAAGPTPPDNRDKSLDFITPVVFDSPGIGHSFGDIVTDVDTRKQFKAGDIVSAVFVGANPRNNLRLEGTFAAVQPDQTGAQAIADDSDWELLYEWKRINKITGTSQVTLTWTVPEGTPAGHYRLVYNGDGKSVGGSISGFTGRSGVFTVAS